MKAKGFVERSGMVICGGLPYAEVELLTSAVPLSQAEQNPADRLAGPADVDPVTIQLTSVKQAISDINKRWHEQSRVGAVDRAGRWNEPAEQPPATARPVGGPASKRVHPVLGGVVLVGAAVAVTRP